MTIIFRTSLIRSVSTRLGCLLAVCLAGPVAAESELADLIQAGQRAAAVESIANGADVNAAQGDGTTALHWAVYKIDQQLVRDLLVNGAQADAINNYGSSPLAEAVKIADPALVEILLDAGANAEATNQDGQTALMLAARSGSLAVAELLIRHGADVNATEAWRGQSVLMWAADANFPELTQLLIDEGASVQVRAMANNWPSQITSEPRAQYRPTGGLSPLLYAARSGCTRCVQSMLDAGADIDQPNPDGVTPLMIAIDNFNYDAARLLIERGANPHPWDWWGRAALYIAVDMSSFNSRQGPPDIVGETSVSDIIRLLLDAGVNPNPQLNMHRPSRGGNIGRFADDLLTTGATPLLRAAIGHDYEAARLLLERGAAVDLPNVMGVTPLMAAAGVGVSTRDRSLSSGGDIESRAIRILDLLIAAGANVNTRVVDIGSRSARIARPSTMTERGGQTALYGAIKWSWPRVTTYLLERGADIDVVDALGKSPLDAALGNIGGRDNIVSEEIAELLRAAAGSIPPEN
jgi:ankyrin repeat protein